MVNKIKYLISTLDPTEIMSGSGINNDKGIVFRLDYSRNVAGFLNAVKETREYRENPLFAQVRFLLESKEDESVMREEYADILRERLFFLDFSELFEKDKSIKGHFNFGKKDYSQQELEAADNSLKLSYLFKNGFTLVLAEQKERRYLPFESSSSMARNCRITFVEASLKKELDERLLLGMDMVAEKIPVYPQKYFAYRGLYMTESVRSGLVLDENKLIVLKDKSDDYSSDSAGSGANGLFKPKESWFISAKAESSDFWEITRKPLKVNNAKRTKDADAAEAGEDVLLNWFDGEGLISPACSKELNGSIGTKGATSFQIRLPFTKGMLHTVDFKGFLKEYCGLEGNREFLITDAFGIKRDINKAEIILTQSMFKCFIWLDRLMKKGKTGKDPMKFYCDQCRTYKHALYVAKTNLSLHNNGQVKLNYQLLNTLGLSDSEFEQLISDHRDYISEIINNPRKQRELLLGKRWHENSEAWKYALSRNLAFVWKDEYIRSRAEHLIKSHIMEMYKGQLIVRGENRFLSGDLLALLIFIYNSHMEACNLQKAEPDEYDAWLKKETLREHKFYMPASKITLKEKTRYSILRNPHLSKNEECTLRPYVAKSQSIYEKYFGRLSGVVMISSRSLVPMILGGADFDGDIIKVLDNEMIARASDKDRADYPETVKIPKAEEYSEECPAQISYKNIKDSYGNQIGHISNLAIRLGEEVYSADDAIRPEFDEKGRHILYTPADCTLLTGLEIDAAKNGNHPTKNIDEVDDQINGSEITKSKADYIRIKDRLDRFYRLTESYPKYCRVIKRRSKGEKDSVSPSSDKEIVFNIFGKEEKVVIPGIPESENMKQPNIEKLPMYFWESMYGGAVKERANEKEKVELFSFRDEEDYPMVKMLYLAYRYYSDRMGRIQTIAYQAEKRKWFAKAYNTIRKQYDSVYSADKGKLSASAALSDIGYRITEYFFGGGKSLQDELESTIRKMKDSNWIYAKESDKKRLLAEILPEGLKFIADNNDYLGLLSNYDSQGYMLLYYLLKDAEDAGRSADRIDEAISERHVIKEDDQDWELYMEACEYLKPVYEEALQYKWSISALKRGLLNRIAGWMTERGIPVYACAKTLRGLSVSFFWELVDSCGHGREIVEEIVKEYKKYQDWEETMSEIGPDYFDIDSYEEFDDMTDIDEVFEDRGEYDVK